MHIHHTSSVIISADLLPNLAYGTELIIVPGKTLGVSTAGRGIYLKRVLVTAPAVIVGWALTNAGGTCDTASNYLIVGIFKHSGLA